MSGANRRAALPGLIAACLRGLIGRAPIPYGTARLALLPLVLLVLGLTLPCWAPAAEARRAAPPPAESGAAAAAVPAAPLTRPEAVVLLVHDSVRDLVNLEPVRALFADQFTMPFTVQAASTDYSRAFLAERNQYYAPQIMTAMHDWRWVQDSVVRILIIKDDIYDVPRNYLFSEYQPGLRIGVISLARLVPADIKTNPVAASQLMAERFVKLLLKSVAGNAGLVSQGCVMSFANSVEELDRKPAAFCPEDTARLQAAGILRTAQPAPVMPEPPAPPGNPADSGAKAPPAP